MANLPDIFAAAALQCYEKSLSPIPLGLPSAGDKAKGASVKGWEKMARERVDRPQIKRWMETHAKNNIGIAMGSQITENYQLVGIDIDLDDIRPAVERAIPSLVSGKRGAKGATWFCLAPLSWKSSRHSKTVDGKKVMAVEVLGVGTQVAIPPSIHPTTNLPYEWLNKSLLDVNLDDLPILNDGFKLELIDILKGKDIYFNGGTIREGQPDALDMSGLNNMTWMGPGKGGDTHDERLRASGYMVAMGWPREDILARLARAMREAQARNPSVPMDWGIVERDNINFTDGALKKNFDTTSKAGQSGGGKKVPPERIFADWAIKELTPLVHTGSEFRRYKDGYWPVIETGDIEKMIYERDRSLKRSDVSNASSIMTRLVLDREFFDQTRPLICLQDGTLDVLSQKLRPWAEEDHLMHQLNFAWHDETGAEPECPNYDAVVNHAFNGCKDSIRTYEEFCGLTLIDDMRFQKLLFIVGPGGTGKSTMADILAAMHSPEAVSSIPLTELHDIRMRTTLTGKLVNISSEQSRMNVLSDLHLKQITGGDLVAVRLLYEEVENVRLKCRLMSVQNELPSNNDVSFAMQRRLIILETPNKVEKPDPEMGKKLLAERPAVLRRWVKALNELLARGRFDPPASSATLIAEYITENSPVQMWIKERCEESTTERDLLDNLYEEFKEWMKNNGYVKPLTKMYYRKQLIALGYSPKMVPVGKSNVLAEMWPLKMRSLNYRVDSRV